MPSLIECIVMSMGESDLEQFIYGEPAPLEDIEMVEALATGLLNEIPAEIVRERTFLCADTNALVTITDYCFEEDDNRGSSQVQIGLSRADEEEAKFTITFGYDNMPTYVGAKYDQDLDDALVIARELLDSDVLDPKAKAIVSHLQMLINCVVESVEPASFGTFSDGSKNSFRHVADVARESVSKHWDGYFRIRQFGWPLADGNVVTVINHEMVGEILSLETLYGLPPVLQVIYEEHTTDVAYTFSRNHDGDVTLDTSTSTDEPYEGEELRFDNFEDEDTHEDTEDIRLLPRKPQVSLLIAKLIDAALVDNFADSRN